MPTRRGPEEEVGAVASVPARVSTLRRLDTCTGGRHAFIFRDRKHSGLSRFSMIW